MDAYVINLEKDKERWNTIQKDFENTNINLIRFNAIDGNTVPREELTTLCKSLCTRGMIGCFASHKELWKKTIEENLPYMLVFEDDAYPLVPNIYEEITNCLQNLPVDYDLCFLHNMDNPITTTRGLLNSIIFAFGGMYNYNHKQINDVVCIPKTNSTTTSYIVSNKGAQKLLELFPLINYHVDYTIQSKNHLLKIYAPTRSLITQNFDSNDSNNNENDKIFDIFGKRSTQTRYSQWGAKYLFSCPLFRLGSCTITFMKIIYLVCFIVFIAIMLKEKHIVLWGLFVIVLFLFLFFRIIQIQC